MDRSPGSPLAIYIHWPFCLSKCPYCDFNSHVAEAMDHARWRAALLAELDYFAAELEGRTVGSIFFGGGTPSLMEPETVAALIAAAGRSWRLAEDVEITLEANPTSVEAGRFGELAAAGVTRLSLGVQSFDDRALAFLGRGHSVGEARAAIDLARSHFPRFSFDLIYALAGQTETAWRKELVSALELAGDHLSLYQLTIEPGTPFFRQDVAVAGEDTAADLYAVTRETTEEAGLPAYEVSNHARPGGESRHNLAYWQGNDYLGLGPGAHGRLTFKEEGAHGHLTFSEEGAQERLTFSGKGATHALHQISTPARWLDAVERQGHGTAKRRALEAETRREEILMMGLRLTAGLERKRFWDLTGRALEDCLDRAGLWRMVEGGFVEVDERGIRTTREGMLRLNGVLAALLASATARPSLCEAGPSGA